MARWTLCLLALVCLALLPGCPRNRGASATRITVAGSTSVTPFAETLAEEFMAEHPGTSVDIQGIGSSAGIQATQIGAAQIGMSSRTLKSEEKADLQEITMALDALAIIIHPSNPLRSLTLEQVRQVFAGQVDNWKALGWRDAPIIVVNREAGSGTRGAFEELVMGDDGPPLSYRAIRQGSNGAVRAVVEGDPRAIGYISLGIVSPQVRVLAIDGVEPTAANVQSGRYGLMRPFLFVVRRGEPLSELGKEYLTYVLSDAGQRSLEQSGLIASPRRELPWRN